MRTRTGVAVSVAVGVAAQPQPAQGDRPQPQATGYRLQPRATATQDVSAAIRFGGSFSPKRLWTF